MLFCCLAIITPALAQQAPPENLRAADLRRDALLGATVVVRPGEVIENAVVLMKNGIIEAVGVGLDVPEGYRTHDHAGATIYAGLIDPAVMIEAPDARRAIAGSAGAHWNAQITPQLSMGAEPVLSSGSRENLRNLGFTVAQLIPKTGILRGSGTIIVLGENDDVVPLMQTSMMTASLASSGWGNSGYPTSRMGAIALLRETFADAAWHARATITYKSDPTNLEPPARADALDHLVGVLLGEQKILFDTDTELKSLRAARIAEEFHLDPVILGSGLEFRRLDEIAATGLPFILPLNYPEKPETGDPWAADSVSLRALQSWHHAPENPRRLLDRGVNVSLTTHRLKSVAAFPDRVRQALDAGLPFDELLACVTTRPAKLLGLEDVTGTIEAGRLANLVVVDGTLFAKDAVVREVWVAGRKHEVTTKKTFPLDGTLAFSIDSNPSSFAVQFDFDAATLVFERPTADDETKMETLKARNVTVEPRRVAFLCDGDVFGVEGLIRATAVVLDGSVVGHAETTDGSSIPFSFREAPTEEDAPEPSKEEEEEEEEVVDIVAIDPLPTPLGVYGRLEMPQPLTVVFRNATIWTSAEAGILDACDLLIRNGTIEAIGVDLVVGDDVVERDAKGLHLTPGLIDCHSHSAIAGGVNEGGQNNTAECRIGDVLDPDDINLYRELAGGLTCSHLLHGSANPIGGQDAVIKLRWGGGIETLRFKGAKPGIKFALGENVKRGGGYPDTRLGIAAFLEDAFRAAAQRRDAQARFDAAPKNVQARMNPPQPDFELTAIEEILAGERLIHCHSYHQDEILMLLRLCERYGITIGTLQHVLEGYKVADEIAAHGAGASSFSDWWAYKMEVMDAIPYNGAIMNTQGVVVSFNSDSDEVARRMNDEGAKAVRWGGLSKEDALAFVTINPARQLQIDDRVGSLEVGKDADLALWNTSPLSSFAVCEETWIDGAKYFNREESRVLHDQHLRTRASLLALAAEKPKKPTRDESPPPDEDVEAAEVVPSRLLSRLLLAREERLLERVHRGCDPLAAEPAACGCGAGSLLDLARSLAAEKETNR